MAVFRHERGLLAIFAGYAACCLLVLMLMRSGCETTVRAALEPRLERLARAFASEQGRATDAAAPLLLPDGTRLQWLERASAAGPFERRAAMLATARAGNQVTEFDSNVERPVLRLALAVAGGRVVLVSTPMGRELAVIGDLFATIYAAVALFGTALIGALGLWQRRVLRARTRADSQRREAHAATAIISTALERTAAAEAQLRRGQELLDSVARMAHIGGWELDAKTLKTQWSPEVYRIHELEPGTAASLPDALDFYAPEARPVMKWAVERALREGTPFDLTLRFITAHGNRRWVRVLGTAERQDGVITRLCGAFQNVTDATEIQHRMARASHASAEGHWEFDFTTQRAWLSDSYQELLGYPRKDRSCTREEFWALLSPEDEDLCKRALQRHITSGTPYDVDLRMRHRGGQWRWFRSRASAEIDERGQPLRFGGSIIDIHNEKLARDELDALRARHERALQGTQDGVWEWNLASGELWLSPRFRELLGRDPTDEAALQLDSAAFLELMHPDDRERMLEATRDHVEHNTTYDLELRLRHLDGGYRWYRSRGGAIRDAAGAVFTIAGSLQDITPQKAAEAGRLEAERRLARAIEGSSDALFDVDLRYGAPVWYSPRLRQMLGYGADETLPVSVRELMNPQDAVAATEAMRRHFEDEVPYDIVYRLRRRDGAALWIRARGRSERGADGRAVHFSGSMQDITAQREAENSLRAAIEAASAANRAKGEFLANMSHEIRTPMNGVIGMTEILLGGVLEPGQRGYAEAIHASATSLLAILNDVLDLSKIEAGKLIFESAPMNPRTALEHVRTIFEPTVRERGVRLRVEVAPEVPVQVLGDPHRLQQVLLNLVGNAVKFTERGEICVRAGVRAHSAGRTLLGFEVRDSGIGMAPATLATLFTPFMQADASTTRHYGGSGLGLSIVQRLLEQLGATIEVSSVLGEGSVFSFTWPCTVLAEHQALPAVRAAPPAREPQPAFEGRVLVVEDHPVNQQVAQRLLERLGCTVEIAENGAVGVERAAAQAFDLIFMDVQMPVMDGLTATRRIRAGERTGQHVPIVALTASVMTDEMDRCLEAGMDDLLTKPIVRARLLAVLGSFLRPGRAPPADSPAHASAVDPLRFAALIGEDYEFAARLNATFTASTREILRGIEAAEAGGDRTALRALAHKLAGSAQGIGADALGALARELERLAPEAPFESLTTLGTDLRRACHATLAALEALSVAKECA